MLFLFFCHSHSDLIFLSFVSVSVFISETPLSFRFRYTFPLPFSVTLFNYTFPLPFPLHFPVTISRYHLSLPLTVAPSRYRFSLPLTITSVFGNASAVHLYLLQSVLNATSHVITRIRKYSATIRDQLHWLPVKQRIDHKLCTLIYKCLYNVAPVYLRDMCIPVSSISARSSLRSAAHGDLWHQRTRTKTFGPRALRYLDHPYEIHWLQLFAIHIDIRTILQ